MTPKVLVIQNGARRSYELAQMLHAKGALAALQTDAAWHELTGPPRRLMSALKVGPATLDRRTVKGIPRNKLHTTIIPNIVGVISSRLGIASERRYSVEDWLLGAAARLQGLGDANIVLNTAGNGGLGFLSWAKSRGAKIVSDIIITPLVHDIVADERATWPGWEGEATGEQNAHIHKGRIGALVAISDLLLCPSENVIDGMSKIKGFDPSRARCVPYSLGQTSVYAGRPIEKRVLFAGQAGLRKGLPYLAQAASLLKTRDPKFEIRVAGSVASNIQAKADCMHLTFLGHLSSAMMEEEFANADVFCLPSLAEGMARVALQALAHGVPCVTTRSSGAPITDGVEGRIVAERDPEALAEAISSIVYNRRRRAVMAEAAINLARSHSLDHISDMLHTALARCLTEQS